MYLNHQHLYSLAATSIQYSSGNRLLQSAQSSRFAFHSDSQTQSSFFYTVHPFNSALNLHATVEQQQLWCVILYQEINSCLQESVFVSASNILPSQFSHLSTLDLSLFFLSSPSRPSSVVSGCSTPLAVYTPLLLFYVIQCLPCDVHAREKAGVFVQTTVEAVDFARNQLQRSTFGRRNY